MDACGRGSVTDRMCDARGTTELRWERGRTDTIIMNSHPVPRRIFSIIHLLKVQDQNGYKINQASVAMDRNVQCRDASVKMAIETRRLVILAVR